MSYYSEFIADIKNTIESGREPTGVILQEKSHLEEKILCMYPNSFKSIRRQARLEAAEAYKTSMGRTKTLGKEFCLRVYTLLYMNALKFELAKENHKGPEYQSQCA